MSGLVCFLLLPAGEVLAAKEGDDEKGDDVEEEDGFAGGAVDTGMAEVEGEAAATTVPLPPPLLLPLPPPLPPPPPPPEESTSSSTKN